MARSRTRIIRSAKLLKDRERASVVLRMMMAVNDAGFAANALQEWTESVDDLKRSRSESSNCSQTPSDSCHLSHRCNGLFPIYSRLAARVSIHIEGIAHRPARQR
jgi:hypothetical protein